MPSGIKSIQVVVGVAGTVIILTDILYYLYLKMWKQKEEQKSNKLKKGKKKSKKVSKHERIEAGMVSIPEEIEPSFQPLRNPWFRYLPRKDFLQGVSQEELWNTALFFPEIFPGQEFSQTRQFMWYMEQATVSLKVAIYTSSFKLLEKMLFELVRKRVKVMVVTNMPRLLWWCRRGVLVREKPKQVPSPHAEKIFVDHMHNKFIIVDDKAILTGSLNWTRSAVQENRENVLVTNDKDTVDLYVKEFDKIWELSDPKKPHPILKAPPLTERQKRTAQRTITKFRKSQ